MFWAYRLFSGRARITSDFNHWSINRFLKEISSRSNFGSFGLKIIISSHFFFRLVLGIIYLSIFYLISRKSCIWNEVTKKINVHICTNTVYLLFLKFSIYVNKCLLHLQCTNQIKVLIFPFSWSWNLTLIKHTHTHKNNPEQCYFLTSNYIH